MILQADLPLVRRPFAALASTLGLTEQAVLIAAQQAVNNGLVRRLGVMFDMRRLGYRSMLCAVQTSATRLPALARILEPVTGITHCYERGWPADLDPTLPGGPIEGPAPNLWFSYACLHTSFEEELAMVQRRVLPDRLLQFPACRRFELASAPDPAAYERIERFPGAAPSAVASPHVVIDEPFPSFDAREKALLHALQDDLPLTTTPFDTPAAQAGCTVDDLLALLRDWATRGIVRRIGLIPRRAAGRGARAMGVWRVAPEHLLCAGRALAAWPEITHCCERVPVPEFPYTMYAMIHANTWSHIHALFLRITRAVGLVDGRLLYSLREFKRAALTYFAESL